MIRLKRRTGLTAYVLPAVLAICLLITGCSGSPAGDATSSAAAGNAVEPIPAEELALRYEKAGDAVSVDISAPEPVSVEEPLTEQAPEAAAEPAAMPEPEAAAETEPEQEPVSGPDTGTASESEPETETVPTPIEETGSEPEEAPLPAAVQGSGRLVVIDPGHSANIPSGSEPLGPGSSEMKAKDAVGTRGTATGVMEYELVLNVSLLLQNELTARGYTVLMTRTSNSDSISCMERAQTANNAGAAVFIRIHADGVDSPSPHGASVLCISSANPFTASTYAACRRLSEALISSYCAATGCYNRGVVETDAMSGNNWSRVPTALIELGFMTNPEEDVLMSSADYQAKMVKGIADGIDIYMGTAGQ